MNITKLLIFAFTLVCGFNAVGQATKDHAFLPVTGKNYEPAKVKQAHLKPDGTKLDGNSAQRGYELYQEGITVLGLDDDFGSAEVFINTMKPANLNFSTLQVAAVSCEGNNCDSIAWKERVPYKKGGKSLGGVAIKEDEQFIGHYLEGNGQTLFVGLSLICGNYVLQASEAPVAEKKQEKKEEVASVDTTQVKSYTTTTPAPIQQQQSFGQPMYAQQSGFGVGFGLTMGTSQGWMQPMQNNCCGGCGGGQSDINVTVSNDDNEIEDDEVVLPPVVVYGCMDAGAFNFNPSATADNGSCNYYACTDPNSCNYLQIVFDQSLVGCDYESCSDCTGVPNGNNGPGSPCNDGNASTYNDVYTSDCDCQGTEHVYGCMDPEATNFNPSATADDGSCEYAIYGCMDELANNYDPNATVDDGSCQYDVYGCMDEIALNYNASATIDDGSCQYGINGCMDPLANNYDPTATTDDGSCEYDEVISGCMDPAANNYNPEATADDGSCQYDEEVEGCIDPLATNYNPNATIDDGSCQYESIYGCMDPLALNYNSEATIDDGSCQYDDQDPIVVYGCTDPSANNYNPEATADDGSCDYGGSKGVYGCTDPLALNYNSEATIDDGSCQYGSGMAEQSPSTQHSFQGTKLPEGVLNGKTEGLTSSTLVVAKQPAVVPARTPVNVVGERKPSGVVIQQSGGDVAVSTTSPKPTGTVTAQQPKPATVTPTSNNPVIVKQPAAAPVRTPTDVVGSTDSNPQQYSGNKHPQGKPVTVQPTGRENQQVSQKQPTQSTVTQAQQASKKPVSQKNVSTFMRNK